MTQMLSNMNLKSTKSFVDDNRSMKSAASKSFMMDDTKSNASSNAPLMAVRNGAHIHVKPRHHMAGKDEEEHQAEAGKILKRISQKTIEFEDNGISPTRESIKVLENIGKCLENYFELEFLVVGHAGHKERGRRHEEHCLLLSQLRAEECMRRIYECTDACFLQVVGHGTATGFEYGAVTFEPISSKLVEPQERLDLIVQRCGWDFSVGSAGISERGRRTALLMAKVMQACPDSLLAITVPRMASAIAVKRSESIAQALRDTETETGHKLEVMVRSANLREDRAQVTIEDTGKVHSSSYAKTGVEPHEEILDILRETPLAFLPNSPELAPNVLPVLSRVATVLKRVEDKTCIVEAYSGKLRKGQDEDNTLKVMVARAQSICDHLRSERVRIPCRAEGYAGPYPGAPESRRPCVVVTLDEVTDDDLSEHDDFGEHACCW